MKQFLIKAPYIYYDRVFHPNSSLVVKNGRIESLYDHQQSSCWPDSQTIRIPEGYYLIPGLIDIFVHGAAGYDVMDATPKALTTLCQTLPQEGVCAFGCATMTESYPRIEQALGCVSQFNNSDGAEIIGIYLEGPFLSAKKAGAQNQNHLKPADITTFEHWQKIANGLIKIVAISPEIHDSLPFINYLTRCNVIASIAHTNASYQQTLKAIAKGATHATHLFNAMSDLNHRNPGAVYPFLLNDELSVELIVDGLHLSPPTLQLVKKIKPHDKIILVSDSIRAKYLNDGEYELGGQTVYVKNNQARLKNQTIAGSLVKMNQAMANMMNMTNASLADVIDFATANPAKLLNLDKKGSIGIGNDADLVAINDQCEVLLTICRGKLSYCQPSFIKSLPSIYQN